MDSEKEKPNKNAQLSLDDALSEQTKSDPTRLSDGTVLKWADDSDKDNISKDEYRMREELQGQRITEKQEIQSAIEHQGISGLKAATRADEERARKKVANLDTRKKG